MSIPHHQKKLKNLIPTLSVQTKKLTNHLEKTPQADLIYDRIRDQNSLHKRRKHLLTILKQELRSPLILTQ